MQGLTNSRLAFVAGCRELADTRSEDSMATNTRRMEQDLAAMRFGV